MDLLRAVTYKLETNHLPLSCVLTVIIFKPKNNFKSFFRAECQGEPVWFETIDAFLLTGDCHCSGRLAIQCSHRCEKGLLPFLFPGGVCETGEGSCL